MTFEPSINHWRVKPVGTFKEQVDRDELREVLKNRPDPIIAGRLYEWKANHRGAGIYDLYVGEA